MRGSLELDRERVAKYQRGIAEEPNGLVPPLIVAALVIPTSGLVIGTLDLGPDLFRIVHGGIDFDFHRRLSVGDAIDCSAKLEGIDDKSSGRVLNVGFDVSCAGELVCQGVTRYFVRGQTRGSKRLPSPLPGSALASVTEVVQQGQSLLYAEGSGDVFPIHTSPEFARSVGLPDVILHGMCTLAFALRAVTRTADHGRLASLSVRFSRTVLHGDALTTHVHRDGDAFAFATDNQRGERVLSDGRAGYAS